jgi:hypothetical protein
LVTDAPVKFFEDDILIQLVFILQSPQSLLHI